MIELKDTIDKMNSDDFKDRFRAEYYQTKIRYEKLNNMVIKYEANTLTFEPKCPLDVLKKQLYAMRDYLYYLALRAEIEDVEL